MSRISRLRFSTSARSPATSEGETGLLAKFKSLEEGAEGGSRLDAAELYTPMLSLVSDLNKRCSPKLSERWLCGDPGESSAGKRPGIGEIGERRPWPYNSRRIQRCHRGSESHAGRHASWDGVGGLGAAVGYPPEHGCRVQRNPPACPSWSN